MFGGTSANTYAGLTKVNARTLALNKSSRFPATGHVSAPGPLLIGTAFDSATVRINSQTMRPSR
jgi:hypothetical protein